MDYGQTIQTDNLGKEQAFFTAGAGTESENVNTFNSEDNLDLTNTQASWGDIVNGNSQSTSGETTDIPHEAPKRHVDSSPKEKSRELVPKPDSLPDPLSPAPELGQVVSTTPSDPTAFVTEQPSTPIIFTREAMMDGDKLSKEAVATLQEKEQEVFASGNIAAFVDEINDFREQFQGRQSA